MTEFKWDAFLGGFVAALLFVHLVNMLPEATLQKAKKAIDECERDLPRNQSCVLTATPREAGGVTK